MMWHHDRMNAHMVVSWCVGCGVGITMLSCRCHGCTVTYHGHVCGVMAVKNGTLFCHCGGDGGGALAMMGYIYIVLPLAVLPPVHIYLPSLACLLEPRWAVPRGTARTIIAYQVPRTAVDCRRRRSYDTDMAYRGCGGGRGGGGVTFWAETFAIDGAPQPKIGAILLGPLVRLKHDFR